LACHAGLMPPLLRLRPGYGLLLLLLLGKY
jgi:hypothetical protein